MGTISISAVTSTNKIVVTGLQQTLKFCIKTLCTPLKSQFGVQLAQRQLLDLTFSKTTPGKQRLSMMDTEQYWNSLVSSFKRAIPHHNRTTPPPVLAVQKTSVLSESPCTCEIRVAVAVKKLCTSDSICALITVFYTGLGTLL